MNIKKITFMVLIVCCVLMSGVLTRTQEVSAASSGQWIDLGKNWRFRVDPPHADYDNANWHVHVENTKTGVKGSEAVNGKASHGDHMNKVDKKIKEKIKNHPEYEKGKKKQKDLDKAKSEIKSRNLKIDWWHIGDVILAIGIVIACTATFFFQGDDIGAWMNLIRALGC